MYNKAPTHLDLKKKKSNPAEKLFFPFLMVQSKNRNGATTTPPTKALFFYDV